MSNTLKPELNDLEIKREKSNKTSYVAYHCQQKLA